MPLRSLCHDLLKSRLRTPSSPSNTGFPNPSLLLEQELEYFETIDSLLSWEHGLTKLNIHDNARTRGVVERQVNENAARVGDQKTSRTRPKLLVCHDFKGGYNEDPFERGYSFEFWHLVDTFIYFSHKRITIPPRGWVDAGHRHGSKVMGTVIFEWVESKPDLEKCLYSGRSPEYPHTTTDAPVLPFSTECASRLIRLAQIRNLDEYLLNIETDLNFLPPVSCYAGKTQKERDEDAASLERETNLAGLGAVINSDVQQRRAQRMKKNASTLSSWVSWLREEGKRLVGSHWEIIWYDSVTTAGQLQWQDALTPANVPFFMVSDAIFTNYTWARPPDPTPPGGLHDSIRPRFEHHPALLTSVRMADSLGRPRADVYVGIDVFGRGCYGGFEVGRSLDLIFPYRRRRHASISGSSSVNLGGDSQSELGLSVALFAPGWTWEREKEGGGERSWSEWWRDELRLWTGIAPAITLPRELNEVGPINDYFGPRVCSFCSIPPALSPPESQALPSVGAVHHSLGPSSSSHSTERNVHGITPIPFYTNFNRGSGNSWWVCGHKFYEAPSPSGGPAEKHGWTDIGSCFPKPDRIWPCLSVLYIDRWVGGTTPLPTLSRIPRGGWLVKRADLVDYDVWHGGTSLEVGLFSSPKAGCDEPDTTGLTVLPLCTLLACHFASHKSTVSSLEIVIKLLSLPAGCSGVHELQLRSCLVWASDESGEEISYRLHQSPEYLGEVCELTNGWYIVRTTVQVGLEDAGLFEQINASRTIVPVLALGIESPVLDSQDSKTTDLKFLVGEILFHALPQYGATLPPPRHASGLHAEDLHWTCVSPPNTATSTSLWGILTWHKDVHGDPNPGTTNTTLSGYFNIFVSSSIKRVSSNNSDPNPSWMWLGTSTYETSPHSFVVAGFEPSLLGTGSNEEPDCVTFHVHHVGATVGATNNDREIGRFRCDVEIKLPPSTKTYGAINPNANV